MSQGNSVQPGPESLRLVVQRQVLTRRNMQQPSTSLLIWKAAAAVVLTCYMLPCIAAGHSKRRMRSFKISVDVEM